jgi:hypothetical protein
VTMDMNSMSTDTHDYCWKLLPWFVTGRLSKDDSQRIERHLEACAACRAELAEQRELCMHVRRGEPVMLAPQASLQKMLARLDDDASTEFGIEMPPEAASDVTATKQHKPVGYRWLAVAAAVQTVAIGLLLTLLWQQTSQVMTAPRFATLSSSSAIPANGTLLRVVFKPETTVDDVKALLLSLDAQVIAGPTEAGVYTLRLPRTLKEEETLRILAQVRGSAAFAEHVLVERRP